MRGVLNNGNFIEVGDDTYPLQCQQGNFTRDDAICLYDSALNEVGTNLYPLQVNL